MGFGATIIDADGLRLTADEKALFREVDPFGFILFARNIDTPDQVRALCAEMRETVGREAVITIDQEGGRVQRLRAPTWREWLPPLDFVAIAGAQAPRAMYLMYRIIADELRDLGVDSNCAPMVDVAGAATHEFLRNRCYSSDPARVALLGRAAADGMLAGGVLPVVKHIPGHGRATMDSHFDLPRVDAALDDLSTSDFAPFRDLADLPMGMTAHLVYDALDDTPATLSPRVMQVIREDIGFDNLDHDRRHFDEGAVGVDGGQCQGCPGRRLRCGALVQCHAERPPRGGRSIGPDERSGTNPGRTGARDAQDPR